MPRSIPTTRGLQASLIVDWPGSAICISMRLSPLRRARVALVEEAVEVAQQDQLLLDRRRGRCASNSGCSAPTAALRRSAIARCRLRRPRRSLLGDARLGERLAQLEDLHQERGIELLVRRRWSTPALREQILGARDRLLEHLVGSLSARDRDSAATRSAAGALANRSGCSSLLSLEERALEHREIEIERVAAGRAVPKASRQNWTLSPQPHAALRVRVVELEAVPIIPRTKSSVVPPRYTRLFGSTTIDTPCAENCLVRRPDLRRPTRTT